MLARRLAPGLAALSTGCCFAQPPQPPPLIEPAPIRADRPAVPESADAAPFDLASLSADVEALASPELSGRSPGTEGDARARALIETRFRRIGLVPAGDGDGYQQAFADGNGHDTANVVGLVRGTDPAAREQVVVVGAHHDHLGVEDGEIYRGANDDASGIAVLMAVATAIQLQPPPRRTIAFVAFGAEEDPARTNGSTFYVEHAPAALPIERTVYMVNLDMVGSYDVEGAVNALGSFPGTTGRALVDARASQHPTLRVDVGDPGDDADHLSFCERGIPYLFFWTNGGDCYHEPCDTPDRIDGPHMVEIARLVAEVTRDLADTTNDLAAEHDELTCEGARRRR